MSEEHGKSAKEMVADEAKDLAKEAYGDVAKPALVQVGNVGGGLVKLVLWPFKLAIDAANTKLDQLSGRVANRLRNVPADRLLPAPVTIAAPAALHYALLGDGDEVAELREMFENLLVASMDRATSQTVHPAFVQMISQLTPDEGWILKSITRSEYAALHVQDYRGDSANGVPRGTWTLLGRGTGIDESRLPQYISNLDRLGILRIESGQSTLEDHASYDKIEQLVARELGIGDPARGFSSLAAAIIVTALGAQFLATCVNVHVPAARYG